jgi:macrodomain Ter protein organizer (MatP/YcbG family)
MRKKRFNISLTQEAWDSLGEFAESMGTTRSGVIELFSKYLNQGEKMKVGNLINSLVQDVFEIFKSGRGPGKQS